MSDKIRKLLAENERLQSDCIRIAVENMDHQMRAEAPEIADPIVAAIRNLAAIAYEDGKNGAAELHPQALELWRAICKDVRELRDRAEAAEARLRELASEEPVAEIAEWTDVQDGSRRKRLNWPGQFSLETGVKPGEVTNSHLIRRPEVKS